MSHAPQPLAKPNDYEPTATDNVWKGAKFEPRPMFFLSHSWKGWEYIETDASGKWLPHDQWGKSKGTGEFLPRIEKIPLVRGAGGVGEDLDPAKLVGSLSKKGCQVFPRGYRPMGPFRNYIKVWDSGRGPLYSEPWERASKLPDGQIKFTLDEAKHTEFRRYMRDEGVVAPMSPEVWTLIRDRHVTEIDRLKELAQGAKSPKLEHMQNILDAMEKAWDAEYARGAEFRAGDELEEIPEESGPDVEPTPAEQAAMNRRKPKKAD